MDKTLAAKLKMNEGKNLILNAPPAYLKRLNLGEKSVPTKTPDVVQLFVKNQRELNLLLPKALKSIGENTVFWVCYPKKTSAIKSDITRDFGWEVLTKSGYTPVSQISIDETWSALRFKKSGTHSDDKSAHGAKKFKAKLESSEDGIDATYITVPFDVNKVFGASMVKVKATFDGYPYRGLVTSMGTGGYIIIVRKDIREIINKKAGDTIAITLERDTDERTVIVPDDLLSLLKKNKNAKVFFDSLSFTNRKEYAAWITAAKKPETREKRLKETISKLQQGLKNPSQR